MAALSRGLTGFSHSVSKNMIFSIVVGFSKRRLHTGCMVCSQKLSLVDKIKSYISGESKDSEVNEVEGSSVGEFSSRKLRKQTTSMISMPKSEISSNKVEDAEEIIYGIVIKHNLQAEGADEKENLKNLAVSNLSLKFKLIKYCHEEFGYIPPNNVINELSSLKDFIEYYSNPENRPEFVKDPLQEFILNEKDLPPNLTIIKRVQPDRT